MYLSVCLSHLLVSHRSEEPFGEPQSHCELTLDMRMNTGRLDYGDDHDVTASHRGLTTEQGKKSTAKSCEQPKA